jgi:hypothetical protein
MLISQRQSQQISFPLETEVCAGRMTDKNFAAVSFAIGRIVYLSTDAQFSKLLMNARYRPHQTTP